MSAFRSVLRFQDAPSRTNVAWRAGLCAFLSVAVGVSSGHTPLGLVGTFGAFAALYGGGGRPLREAGVVLLATFGLTVSVIVGSSAAGDRWVVVGVVAAWSVLTVVTCIVVHCPLPGPLMFLIATAVSTNLPTGMTGSYSVATLLTGLFAVFLTLVDQWRIGPSQAGPVYRWHPVPLKRSPVLFTACRTGLGMAAAGAFATGIHLARPYWAMVALAAVLSQGPHAAAANTRALMQAVGTVVGCGLAGLLLWWHPEVLVAGVLIGLLICLTELTAGRNYTVAMLFITPLTVLLLEAALPPLPVLKTTANLTVNTLIGCGAAVLAGQVVTRRWVARQRYYAVTDTLRRAAAALEDPRALDHLHWSLNHASVIEYRTMAERPNVSKGAAVWDDIASDVDRVALKVTTLATEPDSAERRAAAADIRRLTEEVRDVRARSGVGLGSGS